MLLHAIPGRCGEIYHAKLKRDNITLEVVVKTLAKIDNEKDRSDFAREQAVMSKLMHPNIVGFHGIITDEGKWPRFLHAW